MLNTSFRRYKFRMRIHCSSLTQVIGSLHFTIQSNHQQGFQSHKLHILACKLKLYPAVAHSGCGCGCGLTPCSRPVCVRGNSQCLLILSLHDHTTPLGLDVDKGSALCVHTAGLDFCCTSLSSHG